MATQILDIYRRSSRDHDLQLLLAEHAQQPMRNQFMQSSKEGFQLRPYAGCHFGIGNQLYILQLILLSDCNPCSSRYKFPGLNFSKVVAIIGEVELQEVIDRRILQYPSETLEVFIVLLLHVSVGNGQVKDVLVEGRCEVCVE